MLFAPYLNKRRTSSDPIAAVASRIVFGVFPGTAHTSLFVERTGAAATTPSTVGGPVGTIRCNNSGRYMTTNADVKRPTLEDDSGRQRLSFDGGDTLFTSTIDLAGQPQVTGYFGGQTSVTAVGLLWEFSVAAATNNNAFYMAFNEASGAHSSLIRGSAAMVRRFTQAVSTNFVWSTHLDVSQAARVDAIKHRQNQVTPTYTDSAGSTNTPSAGFGNYPLHFGGRNAAAPFITGKVYASMILLGLSAGQELDDIERYVADRTGVVF